MRTALLSAVKHTSADEAHDLRAQLPLAGRSVLAWQAVFARDLGCERIICLCDGPNETVVALQREIESDGGEFHAVRGNLGLVSLMRADDELVMILDGLLPGRLSLSEFFGADGKLKRGIATIPANHAFAESQSEDFERIDRTRHWAGFAVMRADQVQKLADLPADGDAMSLLLRLALQARAECRALRPDGADAQSWLLADSGVTLAKRERALVASAGSVAAWSGPGSAAAGVLVRALVPRGLEKGTEISAGLAAVFMAGGIGAASFGYSAAGLSLAALGAAAGSVSAAWSALRERLWGVGGGARLRQMVSAITDIAALACLILAYGWDGNPVTQTALPVLAIGLTRLAANDRGVDRANTGGSRAAAFWKDRALHLTGFAVAATAGFLGEGLALFACAALLHLLARSAGNFAEDR